MAIAKSMPEETFGPYEVYERLGIGGMATVHRAKELGIEGFERVVALKRLLPHLADDATFVKAFVREAKLASMLHHVNIVNIFELGRVGAQYFISMEHIDGRDLRAVLRQARRVSGPPPVHVTVALLLQLCDALEYAHTKSDDTGAPLGIVHRDVSPSNLIVTKSGHLKVIDFGIAKAQSIHLKTQTGRVKGKLAYMAPEAISGRELDARSDLFAVGIIAHELITARPLFASKNEYQTILKVQRGEIAPPSTFNQACPPELDRIVSQALAREPDNRYASAAALREALIGLQTMYGLATGVREVAGWIEWAFSIEPPASFSPMPTESRNTGTPSLVSPLGDSGGVSNGDISGRYGATSRGKPTTGTAQLLGNLAGPLGEALPSLAHSLAGGHEETGDEAAHAAWGDGEEAAAPVLLDDVPDVSQKARIHQAYAADAIKLPPIGARLAAPAATSRWGWVILLGFLVGAAALILPPLLRERTTPPSAPPAPTVAPVSTGTIKFDVRPSDAQIKIGAAITHTGSPWQMALEAGPHQVEIFREGYKSYLTSVELSAGENLTLRVVLEPAATTGDATQGALAVTSTPPGFEIAIDGLPTGKRTPARFQVEPGKHVIELRGASGTTLWQQQYLATANSLAEFAPLFSERKNRERKPNGAVAPPPATEAAVVVNRPAADMPAAPLPPPSTPAIARPVAPPITTVAPPPVAPANTQPIIIRPNAVTRLAGEIPKLRASPNEALPSTVAAKVCINPSGTVANAKVLTKLEGSYATTIERAVNNWRYTPHRQAGVAVPACFVVSFRLQ